MIKKMVLALTPVAVVLFSQSIEDIRLRLIILPILAIGMFIGARRGGEKWSQWWTGAALWALGQGILFLVYGFNRPAMLFVLLEMAVYTIICTLVLVLWKPGHGFTAAFIMFPCVMELTGFFFFDDLPGTLWGIRGIFSIIALILYTAVYLLSLRSKKQQGSWGLLAMGSIVYLILAAVLSWPIIGGLILFPVYLPALILMIFTPIVYGLLVERDRASRSIVTSILLTIARTSVLFCIIFPLLTNQLIKTGTPVTKADERVPVIIDTDMSFDDFVALVFLLRQPQLDIRAVTVVNGVAHVTPGVENARRILALCGESAIPVAGGPENPLTGNYAFPIDWRQQVDWGIRLSLPRSGHNLNNISSSSLIREVLLNSDKPVRMIALGPLTNIALVLREDPSLAARFEQIIISGGALYVPGIVHDEYPAYSNTVAEWNIFLDAEAADEVFRCGASLTLIPMDVTDTRGSAPLLFNVSIIEKLSAGRSSDIQFMTSIIRVSMLMKISNDGRVPIWDAAVAAIAADPLICTQWRDLSIHITKGSESVTGQTVVDPQGTPNVRACLAGNQAAFDDAFLQIIH